MKNLLTILLSFLLIITPVFAEDFDNLYDKADLEDESLAPTDTSATEEENTLDNTDTDVLTQNFYTLEIIRESQSAFNKYVPLTLRVTPNETPVKTQITWDIPDDVKINIKHPEFINSMVKGEIYEYKVSIKPNDPGTYEIAVNVTAWQHDTNYTSSETILIEFDDNLVVDSSDSTYQIFNILKIFLIVLAIGGGCVGLYFGGKKLLAFLANYLKPPEL